MTMNAVPRLVYAYSLLGLAIGEWFIKYLDPQANAGNWVAAVFGAFVIRMGYPKLPLQRSLSGWFTGVVLAFMFAPTLLKAEWFAWWESYTVWGLVALVGDLIIQLIAWLIRLGQKFGNYTYDHPREALQETVDGAGTLLALFIKIKAAVLSLFSKTP